MTDIAERHCYQNHPCTGLQSRRTALRRTVLSGGSIAGDFQRIARLDSRSRISDDLKPDALADRLRHKLDRRGGRGCGRSANAAGECCGYQSAGLKNIGHAPIPLQMLLRLRCPRAYSADNSSEELTSELQSLMSIPYD